MKVSVQLPLRRWLHRIAILVVVVVIFAAYRRYRNRPLPFDEATWKSAKTRQEFDRRFRMMPSVRTMIQKGTLRTRQDVLVKLGPPTNDRGQELTYDLGPEHNGLFQLDGDYLDMTFDEDGRLIDATVRTN